MFKDIKNTANRAILELVDAADLRRGAIIVVGCSTSEVGGRKLGSDSNPELGKAIFDGINEALLERGLYLAAQCCEHLNRVIIIERAAVGSVDIVNAVPVPKAGGSFAATAYEALSDPVAVEEVRADAGMDIGGTLIGMHLKKVAVPVRLSIDKIGEANVIFARTRPKYVGGTRAEYDKALG